MSLIDYDPVDMQEYNRFFSNLQSVHVVNGEDVVRDLVCSSSQHDAHFRLHLSWENSFNPSSTRNDQVDSDNNNLGESNMIKEKIIKNP